MADKKNSEEKYYLSEQRRKAEARLAERRKQTGPLPPLDADAQRLVHELEVSQIELEMQNEALLQARAEREAALDQYTDLYDFAPVGYFTLARDGTISKVNLTGAELLGVERSKLLKKHFDLFVVDEFRPVFRDFIEHVFECREKENLEVMLGKGDGKSHWVLIEAIYTDDKQECRAAVTDIAERKKTEELLIENERKLREAQEMAHLGFWRWDVKSGDVEWSDEVFKIFGLNPDTFTPQIDSILALSPWPDEQQRDKELINKAIESHAQGDYEQRFLRPDQSIGYYYSTFQGKYDEDGQLDSIVGTVLDITERKEVEQKIRYQANLLNTVGQAVIATDLSGKIIYWNRFAESLYGWPVDEVMGKNIMDVIVSQASKEQAAEIMEDLNAGKIWSGDFQVQRRDGTTFPAFMSNTPIIDKQGVLTGIIGVSSDISERKQAEEVLKKSEAELKKAQEVSHVGSWAWYTSSNRLEWSDEMFRIFGVEQDEFSGDLSDIMQKAIHPDDRAAVEESNLSVINDGKPIPLEYRIIRPDGAVRTLWAEAGELVLNDAGNPAVLTGIVQDISERVRSQLKLKEYAGQLETLNTVTAALSTSLETDKVLELILAKIEDVIPFDSGAIFLCEKNGWRVVADQGITPSAKGNIFDFGNELFQEIRKTRKSLIMHNAMDDPRFQNWGQSDNIVSWMGIPLIVRDTLIGILTLDSTKPDAYSLEQSALALSFASQAAQAIENARLYQEATQRLERMDSLRKIDQAIISDIDLKATLNILLDQLQERLGVDAAAILLYEKKEQVLGFFQCQGFQSDWIRETNLLMGQGFAGYVAMDRRDLFIQDLDQSEIRALRPEKIKEEGFISYYGIPLIAKEKMIGVLEIFHRSSLNPDSEWVSFLQTLAGQAAIAIDNVTLYSDLQISNKKLSLAYDATIEGWAQALEMRDMETEGHSRRVVNITIGLARTLGYSVENLAHIRRGALLHDIGKMGVPDAILQKPGQLTESEWQVMREHPVYAYNWLSSIDYLKPALDIPYCHHEKWDGTGYPRGLAGEQIPLDARIFAIVDVWDALRSDRPYRKAWSREKTLAYIQAESAKHFDPQIVAAFIKYLNQGGDNRI